MLLRRASSTVILVCLSVCPNDPRRCRVGGQIWRQKRARCSRPAWLGAQRRAPWRNTCLAGKGSARFESAMLHRKIEFKISTAVQVGAAFLVPKVAGGTQKRHSILGHGHARHSTSDGVLHGGHVACADCPRTRLRNKAERLFGAIADPEVITTFGTHLPPQTPNRVPRRWRGARVPTWHGSKLCWRS